MTSHSRTGVPLVQEGEAKHEHGFFCSWMPYQVGQGREACQTGISSLVAPAMSIDRGKADFALGCPEVFV
jgi:hypothetical protein